MRGRLSRTTLWEAALVAALGLTGPAAQAQPPCFTPPPPPANCPPATAPLAVPGVGGTGLPIAPGQPAQPGESAPPGVSAADQAPTQTAALPSRVGGAGVGSSAEFDPAYIDLAPPRTLFRLRYDHAWDNNRPDRAQVFYPPAGPGVQGDRTVDYEELRSYVEYAVVPRFSGFIEVPVRWIEPDVFPNAGGLSNINFGFKYAVVYDPVQVVTFQIRTFTPTGEGLAGLSSDTWALEPAILAQRRVSDRLIINAEFRDYITLAEEPETGFGGNVLRYGVGASYLLYNAPQFRVSSLTELVGWTALTGRESKEGTINVSASGDTIVNAKVGARFSFGEQVEGFSFLGRSDFAVSYGRALTGEVWYKDIFRLEYRLRF